MMTHDEMIAVIAAHRDGKKIQAASKSEKGESKDWIEVIPDWDFHNCDYRVKPDPIEAWAVVLSDGDFFTYSEKKHAEVAAINYKDSRVIRMIEAEEGGEP